ATKHRGQLHVEAGGCSKGKSSSPSAANSEASARGTSSSFRGGTEDQAWFPEDTEGVEFFSPPREDFLIRGKPPYQRRGQTARSVFSRRQTGRTFNLLRGARRDASVGHL